MKQSNLAQVWKICQRRNYWTCTPQTLAFWESGIEKNPRVSVWESQVKCDGQQTVVIAALWCGDVGPMLMERWMGLNMGWSWKKGSKRLMVAWGQNHKPTRRECRDCSKRLPYSTKCQESLMQMYTRHVAYLFMSITEIPNKICRRWLEHDKYGQVEGFKEQLNFHQILLNPDAF